MSEAAVPQLAVPGRHSPVPLGLRDILGTPAHLRASMPLAAENDESRAAEAFPAGGNLRRLGRGGPRVASKVGGSLASPQPAQWVEQGRRGQRPQTLPLPAGAIASTVQLAMQPLPPPPARLQPRCRVQGAVPG